MSKIRIKLDLPFEYALRISVILADDAHECEKMARYYDESKKTTHSKFYRNLANLSSMIKEELNLQIEDPKNVYIGGCEDESARA